MSPSQKTEAQKILRQLCSCNVTPGIENQVMDLLNQYANPALIQVPEPLQVEDAGVIGLQSKLDEALAQQPIDEDAAKHLAFQLAATQYSAIGSEEYETERLCWLFRQAVLMESLDAALLKNTVAAVCINGHGAVGIHLKTEKSWKGEKRHESDRTQGHYNSIKPEATQRQTAVKRQLRVAAITGSLRRKRNSSPAMRPSAITIQTRS